MKWIILLVLILVAIAMVAYRYRKYLQSAWFMYQTFRKFKKQVKPKQKQVTKNQSAKETPLVSCPKCGKWTPKDEAVKLKSNFYCSLSCMEQSVSFKR